jgi:methylase of polypeptide subunit release factors
MLNTNDIGAIRELRDFLEDTGFRSACRRLVPHNDELIFPGFGELQESLRGASSFHRLLLSVFRQGHCAAERHLKTGLTTSKFELMKHLGLLVEDERGEYRTPGLALVSTAGLFLVVSLPPDYPTARDRKQPVYIGAESTHLVRALPASLRGKVVLDICSGSGIQGLVCASRGAKRVIGLEKSPLAVNLARFNAILNGLDDVVEVRESDLYSALRPDERFDFVVSNPPFMPVTETLDYPICGGGGADGMSTMIPLLSGLPQYLCHDASGFIYCNVIGDQHRVFLHEHLAPTLKSAGLHVSAFVELKMPIEEYAQSALAQNLRNTCPEADEDRRRKAIDTWRDQMRAMRAEYVYGQILRFKRGETKTGFSHVPFYQASATDPLVAAVRTNRMAI